MENREGALNFSKIAFLERFAKFTEPIRKNYQTLDIVKPPLTPPPPLGRKFGHVDTKSLKL